MKVIISGVINTLYICTYMFNVYVKHIYISFNHFISEHGSGYHAVRLEDLRPKPMFLKLKVMTHLVRKSN